MNDGLCVGVCMIDWDAGVCLGCGRSAAEIDGTGAESALAEAAAPSAEASAVALLPASALAGECALPAGRDDGGGASR